MPRRNNRDRKYEPKENDNNNSGSYYDYPSPKQKPTRRRKGQWDKKIYRDDE